jgi:integrase
MNLHMHDLRRDAGSRLLERGADLPTAQLFRDHANISTSSRYLKPSKLALHTTIQRIDEQRRREWRSGKIGDGGGRAAEKLAEGTTKRVTR